MEVLMGWPLNKDGGKESRVITAGYAYKDGSAHNAIDMSTGRKDGLPVYAALDGVVNFTYNWNGKVSSGDTNSYGNCLKIKHDNYRGKTLETLYAHLSKISVVKGQKVKMGDIIGYSGHTGYVVPAGINGAHLHFEVRLNGSKVGINPLCWLDDRFVPADKQVKLFRAGEHSVAVQEVSSGGGATCYTGSNDANAIILSESRTGIDVSRYQGKVDWNAVKRAGVKFAIIRAGYGQYISQKDPYFEINYAGAKAAGIPCGAYWYSYAKTAQAGITEAGIFNQVIKGKQFELPVYFDQEDKSLASLTRSVKTSIATAFCAAMLKYGWFPGYYCYTAWAAGVDYAGIAKMYTCWLADYRTGYDKVLPRDIHQYTSKGRVAGIGGDVDMNTMTRDFETEIRKSGLNGWDKAAVPSPTPPIAAEDVPQMNAVSGKVLKINAANCEYFSTYSTANPIGKLVKGELYPVVAVEKSGEYVNGFSWVTFMLNDVTYWCARVEDNRATVEDAPKAEVPVINGAGFKKGQKVKLVGKLYANSTTATGTVRSGTWYLYDGVLYGKRYRVTNLASRVGKMPVASNVSGYVNAADIEVI